MFLLTSKQLIQQNPIPDFIPVGLYTKGVKKQVGIKIWVNLAAEGSVEVVFEASVAEGYVYEVVFYTVSCSMQFGIRRVKARSRLKP